MAASLVSLLKWSLLLVIEEIGDDGDDGCGDDNDDDNGDDNDDGDDDKDCDGSDADDVGGGNDGDGVVIQVEVLIG